MGKAGFFSLIQKIQGAFVEAVFLEKGMHLAFKAAQEAFNLGEVPVGAVVMDKKSGFVWACCHNEVEHRKIPIAHAEILAIERALKERDTKFLNGCAMYVTLEPCAMCAAALAHVRIDSLFFGAYDSKGGGVEHGAEVFRHGTCHHKPEIYGGFGAEASEKLLKNFFENRREV